MEIGKSYDCRRHHEAKNGPPDPLVCQSYSDVWAHRGVDQRSILGIEHSSQIRSDQIVDYPTACHS